MSAAALEEAIRANDPIRVRELCRAGADVNAMLPGGQTPLTLAMEVARVPVIRVLLAAFAEPSYANSAGEDALERAVKLWRKNVLRVLADLFSAERRADAERRMPYFVKPAAAPTREDAADPFANHPAAVFTRAVKQSAAAGPRVDELVAAAERGDVATVRRLLADGVDPDAMDVARPGKETALDLAMLRRHVDVIAALAAAGADLDHAPLGADRPVFVAIEWDDVALLRALGEVGADLRKTNRNGLTPLEFAQRKQSSAARQELLRIAADPLPPPITPYEFLPPPAPPTAAPPGQHDHFGLPTADVISVGLLVESDVATVASALFELLDADVHYHNAIGREFPATAQGYVVWRLAGHAWTAVTQVDALNGALAPAHAAALAERLAARAIFVSNSDTAGYGAYALFDADGVVQEVFEQNDDAERLEEPAAIADAIGRRLGVDPSPFTDRMSWGGGISFGSVLRNVTVDDIDNPRKFFDEFLTAQQALAPSAWTDEGVEPGDQPNALKLVLPAEDFGDDVAFERVDYVGVTGPTS